MTWKAVAGVLLIFVLGCLFGGLATWMLARHQMIATLKRGPEAVAPVLERRLGRGLTLEPGQKTRLHDIFVQYLEDRQELQKQLRPQVQALNQATMKEIDAVLNPDQQARFRENVAKFDENTGRHLLNTDASPSATATNAAVGGSPVH